MRRNSQPPSKRCELAPEQETAEQEHRLADNNGGKHRPFDANEGNKPARRCGYAYGKRNVVERTAWKNDELGDDRRSGSKATTMGNRRIAVSVTATAASKIAEPAPSAESRITWAGAAHTSTVDSANHQDENAKSCASAPMPMYVPASTGKKTEPSAERTPP
jgi:hypothetical protein